MSVVLVFVIMVFYCQSAASALAAASTHAVGGVVEVINGSTITLDRLVMGSQTLRLAGIEAPQAARGQGDEGWPLAEEARRALADLVHGHHVYISVEGLPLDRYRRLVAHVHHENGSWLQGEMLAQGMARVHSLADNRERVAEMLAIEQDARVRRRGIWAHPFYRVRSPDDAKSDIGTFQIVEGVVLDRARVRDRIYLNFGPDWRIDFTVSIDTRLIPIFENADLNAMDLKGRKIRVRGWIQSRNGPLIEATHPEQIEVLPDSPPGS